MQAFESSVEICNMTVDYKEVFDFQQLAGQHTFPFEVQLPDWLPPSTLISNVPDCATMQIRYEIRA